MPSACSRPGRSRDSSAVRIALTVNGVPLEGDVWGGESLLTFLRDTLELPGSKNACEQGECGSCSSSSTGRSSARASCSRRRRRGTRSSRSRGSPARTPCIRCSRRSSTRAPSSAASARPARRRRRRPPRPRPAPLRRRDPRVALGEPLPLHGLREDLRRRPDRRGARMSVTTERTAHRRQDRRAAAPRRRRAQSHGRVRVRE